MKEIWELGTDFNSNWSFNSDGDLDLVSNTDNLIQSMTNRLNTFKGALNDFYYEYGSYLHTFIGARRNLKILDFIMIEVKSCLQQDPRLIDFIIDGEYDDDGKIRIDIIASFYDNSDLSMSLVITEDMVVNIDAGE